MNSKDPLGTRIKWFVVKGKVRINRGLSWLDFIRYPAYGTILLFGLNEFLSKWDITIDKKIFSILYVLVPISIIVGAFMIGWLDENYGFWKFENIYGSFKLNPQMESLNNKITEIHKLIKEKQ